MNDLERTASAIWKRFEAHQAVQFYTEHWAACLLILEACASAFYIWFGPLHPIDYPTYLQQARTFTVDHDLDYSHMHGATGRLVYPALHLYIFSLFERLFGIAEQDPEASPWLYPQLVFLCLNLLVTRTIHRIYAKLSTRPQWDCFILLITVRARNVFVNGLFNDGFEVLFVYAGILQLLKDRTPALVLLLFSAAASVKMNALLWGPGLAAHYLTTLGLKRTLKACRPAVFWQLFVGLPFLLAHPYSYISRSFQLTREFKWFNSVYWKWLPTSVFYASSFHIFLQLSHLVALAVLITMHLRSQHQDQATDTRGANQSRLRRVVFFLIATHFSGIVFAKSLHYSFFIWYYHTLPALYIMADLPWLYRPLLHLWIEVCWNQWHQYKTNPDGSVDRLDSCGSWKGGLGMFVAHMLLGAMVLRQCFVLDKKERLTLGVSLDAPIDEILGVC